MRSFGGKLYRIALCCKVELEAIMDTFKNFATGLRKCLYIEQTYFLGLLSRLET